MDSKQGPFDTLDYAQGFVLGVEYANSFFGESGLPVPVVTRPPYQDRGTNKWFVDVEYDSDEEDDDLDDDDFDPAEYLKLADHAGLSETDWFRAFVAVHEQRTGMERDEFYKPDVITAYYSPTTTPSEGVDEDIEKHGLDRIDE